MSPAKVRGAKRRPRDVVFAPVAAGPLTKAQYWSIAAQTTGYQFSQLAKFHNVTPRQVERYCERDLGRSPRDWMMEQRMIAARWLLRETLCVKQVSMQLGFKQVSHFCRLFKSFYGLTPSQFIFQHLRFSQNVAPR